MLRLSTNELLFKHGNSETMSDFMEENDLWPDTQGNVLLSDYVLIALYKKYVLPKIEREIKYVVMNPLHHNPIRLTHVGGVEIDWDADFHDGIELLPDYVEIPNDVVMKEYEIQREEIANT